jgi:Tol biopolymer transport system component
VRGNLQLTSLFTFLTLMTGLMILFSGCNDLSTGTEPYDPIQELVISKKFDQDRMIWVGDIIDLTVQAVTAKGTPINIHQADWSIDDDDIASIGQNGQLHAKASGTVTVTASHDSFTGSLQLNILTYDLIFDSNSDGISRLYSISLNNSEEPELLFDPGIPVSQATISPDEQTIAYVSPDGNNYSDIYLYEMDTETNRHLINDSKIEDMPAWSPDSRNIAYRSFQDQGNGNIFALNLDTDQITNLTPDSASVQIEVREPSWSPDGNSIVYSSNTSGSMNLWIVNADGSSRQQITDSDYYSTDPAWSPDGEKIAFRRSYQGGSDILILNLTDMTETRIEQPGYQQSPSWSPDGRWIAFSSQSSLEDQSEIFVIRPNGADQRQITTNPSLGGGLNPSFMIRRDSY